MTSHDSSPILTNKERDLLQASQPGYGSRSAVEVAFNLVNATVGAGIIGCKSDHHRPPPPIY